MIPPYQIMYLPLICIMEQQLVVPARCEMQPLQQCSQSLNSAEPTGSHDMMKYASLASQIIPGGPATMDA